jgi:hypothetical protein
MQKLLRDFFKKRFLRTFGFLFFSSQAFASCYELLLREHIQVRVDRNSHSKGLSQVDGKQVEVLGHAERYFSEREIVPLRDGNVATGLEQKIQGHVRSHEQISAWFEHISNRLRKVREAAADVEVARSKLKKGDPQVSNAPLMSVEEFFGMIDGAFGSHDASIGKIMGDFDIKYIRFVDKKDFKLLDKKILKKKEVILEIPDVDFENHLEAALWVKDFTLALHEVARKHVAAKLEAAKPNEAKKLWEVDSGDGVSYREKTRSLDLGVGDMLQELTHYIENSTSAFMPNELTKLKDKNFKHKTLYPLATAGVEVMGVVPGTQFLLRTVNVTHPYDWYEPSRLWVEGKDSVLQERKILEDRMNSYFSRKKRSYYVESAQTWIFRAGLVALAYGYVSNGTVLKNYQDKVQDLKNETELLNNKIQNPDREDKVNQLKKNYKALEKKLEKAMQERNDLEVLKIKEEMTDILDVLDAMGFDSRRIKESANAP